MQERPRQWHTRRFYEFVPANRTIETLKETNRSLYDLLIDHKSLYELLLNQNDRIEACMNKSKNEKEGAKVPKEDGSLYVLMFFV